MKEIQLTQGKVALVDDCDFEELNQHKWTANRHILKNRLIWYAVRHIRRQDGIRRTLGMHQQILSGVCEIDHRDGDGLNNRRSNLRPATHSHNQWNRHKSPGHSSRFKGVVRRNKTRAWHARITFNREVLHLGYFSEEEDAAKAYDLAARKNFGEFALTNLPA
jgi:hypothetical protein